jgi:hypothetical protein
MILQLYVLHSQPISFEEEEECRIRGSVFTTKSVTVPDRFSPSDILTSSVTSSFLKNFSKIHNLYWIGFSDDHRKVLSSCLPSRLARIIHSRSDGHFLWFQHHHKISSSIATKDSFIVHLYLDRLAAIELPSPEEFYKDLGIPLSFPSLFHRIFLFRYLRNYSYAFPSWWDYLKSYELVRL